MINDFLESRRPKMSVSPGRSKIKIGGLDNEAFSQDEFNKMDDIEKQVYNLPVLKGLNNRIGDKIK